MPSDNEINSYRYFWRMAIGYVETSTQKVANECNEEEITLHAMGSMVTAVKCA